MMRDTPDWSTGAGTAWLPAHAWICFEFSQPNTNLCVCRREMENALALCPAQSHFIICSTLLTPECALEAVSCVRGLKCMSCELTSKFM